MTRPSMHTGRTYSGESRASYVFLLCSCCVCSPLTCVYEVVAPRAAHMSNEAPVRCRLVDSGPENPRLDSPCPWVEGFQLFQKLWPGVKLSCPVPPMFPVLRCVCRDAHPGGRRVFGLLIRTAQLEIAQGRVAWTQWSVDGGGLQKMARDGTVPPHEVHLRVIRAAEEKRYHTRNLFSSRAVARCARETVTCAEVEVVMHSRSDRGFIQVYLRLPIDCWMYAPRLLPRNTRIEDTIICRG